MTETGKKVFLLYHQKKGEDSYKIVGVFSSRANAVSVKKKKQEEAGFRDHKNGFHIDNYVVDMEYWRGGFFTVDDDVE